MATSEQAIYWDWRGGNPGFWYIWKSSKTLGGINIKCVLSACHLQPPGQGTKVYKLHLVGPGLCTPNVSTRQFCWDSWQLYWASRLCKSLHIWPWFQPAQRLGTEHCTSYWSRRQFPWASELWKSLSVWLSFKLSQQRHVGGNQRARTKRLQK